jgi:hypothetical protein
VVTSGPTMRKKVLKLNEKQLKKWAADKDKRPSSAVWVKRGGRERHQEVHDLIDFNLNLFNDHEEYFEGRDGGILQDPAVLNFRVQRQRVQERRRLADVVSGRGLPLCTCSLRETVDVRHIDLGRTYIDLD